MKKLLILNSTLIALLLGYTIYGLFQQKQNIVYVDTIKVFNEYKFKKELEKSTEHTLISAKQHLDSLAALYNAHPDNQQLKQELYDADGRFSESYKQINKEINEQVWSKLNELVTQFGKERNCQLIIGANGMGTVLYGEPTIDATNDLIQYVNKNYEG